MPLSTPCGLPVLMGLAVLGFQGPLIQQLGPAAGPAAAGPPAADLEDLGRGGRQKPLIPGKFDNSGLKYLYANLLHEEPVPYGLHGCL